MSDSLSHLGVGLQNRKPKINRKKTEPLPKKIESKKIKTEHAKPNRTELVRFRFRFRFQSSETKSNRKNRTRPKRRRFGISF